MDKRLTGLIALIVAGIAVERFFQHPTYGRGLNALAALIRAEAAL
jgi:hypothetical protein